MRRQITFLAVYLLIVAPPSVFSQGNPFLSGTPDNQQIQVTEQSVLHSNRIIGPLLRRSIALQRTLQREISETMQNATEKGDFRNLIILLGISFAYGFFHVMGPGHRKTLLVGYFIGEEAKPAAGIRAGFLMSFAHAGSAIILVGGFYWFASRSLLVSINQAELILFPVTYGIIALLGAWMIFQGVRNYRRNHQNSTDSKGLGGLVLAGLVPCPGAAAIMIFAVASDALFLGILAVLVMSAGMGLFLSGLGLLSILFRRSISRIFEEHKRGRILDLSLHLVCGSIMICFGAFLLAGCLPG